MTPTLSELYLIRHGQSAGNVARDEAIAGKAHIIEIEERDCDVALSPLGMHQASALGEHFAHTVHAPDALISSPYHRAYETSELIIEAAGWHTPIRCDERLREKEFGILDRLTHWGVAERFPDEAQARKRLGKFYYRPPGGESWVDVILRLRSAWTDIRAEYAGQRVIIVAHQVIVLCMRYIIEDLTEKSLLTIDRAADVANCSVTHYVADATAVNGLRLDGYNSTAPLEEHDAPVTNAPDSAIAAT